MKIFIFVLAVFLLFSCNKSNKSEVKNDKKESVKKSVKKEVKEIHKPDQKEIKAQYYEVIFDFKDEINAGEDFLFNLKAVPKNHRHINTGFPVSLKFDDGCFKFEKNKFKAQDAKNLTEKELSFNLKSKCEEKGVKKISGSLKFGYCTDEMCYTYNSPFSFKIRVK